MEWNFYDHESENNINEQFILRMVDAGLWKVDGSHFGNSQRCYLPIFRHNREGLVGFDWGANDIYFGAHLMQQNTFVFDNTPFSNHG
jgi:hypothetical protein